MESHRRTLAKSVTFRALATIATVGTVFYFTGNAGIAGTVGGIDALSKFGLYYFHERAWDRCHWGMEPKSIKP
ncbi:MAG TPA: DUF2061 domain-containing protein [Candidatus Nanoarchaeia archaeon]|nr:DUF2061 domain-containing protein [Candidatus Nanoarchaeia archaeon]